MVPPFGYVVIKQCYDAGPPPSLEEPDAPPGTFGGKFVFHCHFLPHEDTGLVRHHICNHIWNHICNHLPPSAARGHRAGAAPHL